MIALQLHSLAHPLKFHKFFQLSEIVRIFLLKTWDRSLSSMYTPKSEGGINIVPRVSVGVVQNRECAWDKLPAQTL